MKVEKFMLTLIVGVSHQLECLCESSQLLLFSAARSWKPHRLGLIVLL